MAHKQGKVALTRRAALTALLGVAAAAAVLLASPAVALQSDGVVARHAQHASPLAGPSRLAKRHLRHGYEDSTGDEGDGDSSDSTSSTTSSVAGSISTIATDASSFSYSPTASSYSAESTGTHDKADHERKKEEEKEQALADKEYATTDSSTQTLIPVSKTDPGVYPGIRNGAVVGWPFMPDLTSLANATLDTTSIKVGDDGATLTHYITSNYSASTAKRAIIMVHGDDRTSWNMQIYTNKALLRAVTGGGIDYDDVVVSAPQFFETIDAGAYPVKTGTTLSPADGALVWSGSQWGDGSESTFPSNASVGAFDALDALSAFFLDKTKFPQMNAVVVAGFSMGGQLVQRYSVFRPTSTDDSRLRYWVSSPASFVYFNDSRPVPIPTGCTAYNQYKYGMDGVLPAYVDKEKSTTTDFVNNYVTRTLNFMVGTADHIAGDNRCQANAQGINHVAKMYYWITTVMPYIGANPTGSLPSKSTIDYVEGVQHDPWNIINSDPGVERLFLDDYNSNGSNAAAPASNGIKSGQPSGKDLKAHSNAAAGRGDAAPSTVALALLSVLAAVAVLGC